jgi:glycerophosphoryl diester phosphodiesterase
MAPEMGDTLRNVQVKFADALMALIPRRVPDQAALQKCRIISHRGEHDNVTVQENTLCAYDIARSNGVWGIEGDIRWTADLVPVICHDPDGRRVFGKDLLLQRCTFVELREQIPQIPTLAELLAEFGGSTHLMLELKEEPFPQPQRQRQILQQQLSALKPGEDYHILALDPRLFDLVDFLPRQYCLTVAEENLSALSRATLAAGYGGLTGHFLLLNNRIKQRHERQGQRLGTGFVRSRNCLFRELNRGIEWVFSNDAVKLQKILESSLNNAA